MLKSVAATAVLVLTFSPIRISAQWHTSLHADSALCVLPGFSVSLLTYDDGSSIVCGTGTYNIYLQKLNELGYVQWPNYVEAYNVDSGGTNGGPRLINDGDGGVILWWGDYRGATPGPYGPYDNALYAQRVDKNGSVLWLANGMQLAPAYTGQKGALGVNDGNGGAIFVVNEQDFLKPGATDKARLWAARFDPNGQILWKVIIDSSTTENSFLEFSIVRAGNYVYSTIMRYGAYSTLIFDLQGHCRDSTYWSPDAGNTSWRDSILYRVEVTDSFRMSKIGPAGDTIWTARLPIESGCQGFSPFKSDAAVPDAKGGIFYPYVCGDTIFHVDYGGNYKLVYFPEIGSIGGYLFADGHGGIVAMNFNFRGQRWDENGAPIWPQKYQCVVDSQNAYFPVFQGDDKGGIITAFWTTSGCIRMEHSGRYGQVGVLTSVADEVALPASIELCQNYPNPFNPSTTIEYTLAQQERVRLLIYDLLGREVETVINEKELAGVHRLLLDFSSFPSGVYFYRLSTGATDKTRKMILVR